MNTSGTHAQRSASRKANSTATIAAAAAVLLGAAGAADAQRYELALGGPNTNELAYDVEVITADGDYVTVGSISSSIANTDIHVARFDRLGNKLWDTTYAAEGFGVGYSIDVLESGDLVLAGISALSGPNRIAETVVMRLRPDSSVVWSRRFAGTAFTDPIHTPEVGPSLDVGVEDAIYVTSVLNGDPVAMRLRPDGSLVWANSYFYPFDDREVVPAFSDVKYDRANDQIVVSGTVRIDGPTPGTNLERLQDPMLVRLRAANGAYVFATHTNLSANEDIDTPEVGEGLDLNIQTGTIALAGESDRSSITGGPISQLLTLSDFGLNTLVANRFGSPNADSRTGSAAVRYSDDRRLIAVAGSFSPAGGPASLTLFDDNAMGLQRRHLADQANLDAIVPAPSCGWLAAGRIAGFLIGGVDDMFHVKTNNLLDTGCNQQPQLLEDLVDLLTLDLHLEREPLDIIAGYSVDPFDPFDQEAALCFSPFCAPCRVDWNNDGVVNILDVVAFITTWNAMGPGADFNNDGVINILDVVAFITAWNNGCV